VTQQMIDPALSQTLIAAACGTGNPPTSDTPEAPATNDHAEALAEILRKAKGVRSTGEKLVDAYVDRLWSERKLSKIEAARMGLVAGEHNPEVWKQLQTLRGELKAAVRKDARAHAHVAPKIAASTKVRKDGRTPELDAFLLQHADDQGVQQLAQLLGL